MAAMLLVNNPGNRPTTYGPLLHSHWNGCTPTDLIFPFFLFIVGAVIPLALARSGNTQSKCTQFNHITTRSLALLLLGSFFYAIPKPAAADPSVGTLMSALRMSSSIFLIAAFVLLLYPWKRRNLTLAMPVIVAVVYVVLISIIWNVNSQAIDSGAVSADYNFGGGMWDPAHQRWTGILQRIAICYFVTATLVLCVGWRSVATISGLILTGYALLVLAVPHPSLVHPDQMVYGALDAEDNLARYVDTTLLGPHLRQPLETTGLFATIPAIANTMLGALVGYWLLTNRSTHEKCAGMLAFGVLLTLTGYVLDPLLMPMNKVLWSSTYVLYSVGLAMLGLGTFYFLSNIHHMNRPFVPLKWFGMNAILAYCIDQVGGTLLEIIPCHDWSDPTKTTSLARYLRDAVGTLGQYWPIGDPAKNASLAYAITWVIACGLILWMFHRRRIYLKV